MAKSPWRKFAKFDPTILQLFERKISTWPPEQAAAALRIVRAVIAGDRELGARVLDPQSGELGELTVDQLSETLNVIRRIVDDWTH